MATIAPKKHKQDNTNCSCNVELINGVNISDPMQTFSLEEWEQLCSYKRTLCEQQDCILSRRDNPYYVGGNPGCSVGCSSQFGGQSGEKGQGNDGNYNTNHNISSLSASDEHEADKLIETNEAITSNRGGCNKCDFGCGCYISVITTGRKSIKAIKNNKACTILVNNN